MSRLRALGLGPELIPGLLAVGLFIVWAASGGGFEPTTWYPGALLVLGLLALALILSPRWRRPHPVVLAAIALLAAFVVWSFASISWAEVKGDAWDGANRSLLFLTVFALFALPAWPAASAGIVLGAYALGLAGVAAGTLIGISGAEEPVLSFLKGSLTEPTGYHNATAALFAPAAIVALHLGSRRETPWPVRGLLLAAAVLCAEITIPAQSRGSAIVLPIALVVYFALVPSRVRALIALLPVAAVTAIAAGPLLDIYSAAKNDTGLAAAIDDAASTVWLTVAVVFVIGTVIGLVDRLVGIPARVARGAAVGCAVLAVAGVIVGSVIALDATGNPVEWAQDRWDDFKGGYNDNLGSNRFSGSLGSNRYDFWRVGMDEFSDHPLAGVGADNFAVDYVRNRKSSEEPIHPHSLEVRLLSQTGLIGTLLFVGFLFGALAAGIRGLRRGPRFGRGIAAASLGAFAYWVGHASGDWLWAFPGISAPAFAWLGLAGAVEEPVPEPEPEPEPERLRVGADYDPDRRRLSRGAIGGLIAVGALLLVAAAVSYLRPLAAAEDVAKATQTWGANPKAAFERLDRAASWDPLSDEPYVFAGAIAERLGNLDRMRTSFEEAIDRNPYNWYSLLELGALDSVEGNRKDAITRLRDAAELNPREPLIGDVLGSVRAGEKVRLRAIDQTLLGRVCNRFGRTNDTEFCS